MLKTVVRMGTVFFVSNLSRKTLSISLLSIMLAVSLSYIVYIMLKYILSISNLLSFFFLNHEWMLNFVNCFFSHIFR